jgi:glucose-6-phosphate 1-dehydrogenase
LRITIVPEKKVSFLIHTKAPGLDDKITTAELALNYEAAFPQQRVPDAYETVLRAVLKGDQSMCK